MPGGHLQVAPCYPKRVDGFVEEVTALLQTHAAILDPSLRRTLVKALILMRNRDQVCAESSPGPLLLVCSAC